jgi:hypothetical protein
VRWTGREHLEGDVDDDEREEEMAGGWRGTRETGSAVVPTAEDRREQQQGMCDDGGGCLPYVPNTNRRKPFTTTMSQGEIQAMDSEVRSRLVEDRWSMAFTDLQERDVHVFRANLGLPPCRIRSRVRAGGRQVFDIPTNSISHGEIDGDNHKTYLIL